LIFIRTILEKHHILLQNYTWNGSIDLPWNPKDYGEDIWR